MGPLCAMVGGGAFKKYNHAAGEDIVGRVSLAADRNVRCDVECKMHVYQLNYEVALTS